MSSAVSLTVLNGPSPATNFKVCLLEVKSDGKPSLSRTQMVFQVFDEVLPHLGLYQDVLLMVRNELFESVFSDQYSSARKDASKSAADHSSLLIRHAQDGDPTDTIQIDRIPYFTLLQNLLGQRNGASEILQDEITALSGTLSEREASLDQSRAEGEELAGEKEKAERLVADKEDEIIRAQEQNIQLEEDMAFFKETAALEKRRLVFENNRLQDRIDGLEKEKDELDQYKQAYDSMQDAFIFRPGEDKFTLGQKRARKPVVASKKNHLMTNMQAAKKLEEQLLEVQNQCITEFDSYLESHKATLQSTLPDTEKLVELDVELNTTQDRFTHTIGSLQEELLMVRQHLHYLERDLDTITKPSVPKPPSRGGAPQPPSRVAGPLPLDQSPSTVSYGKQSQMSGKDSVLSPAENFENVDILASEMDPFIPQEAILSKYSLMVYTSTDGKESFHQLIDAKFCPSCCEMTVVCPHKVSQEKVITLPHNCTHIKLTRPKIKVPAERKQRRPYPPSRGGKGHQTHADIAHARPAGTKRMLGSSVLGGARLAMKPFHKDSVTPGVGGSVPGSTATPATPATGNDGMTPIREMEHPTESAQEHTQNPLSMIWDDYMKRTNIIRNVPKPMDIQQCLSLIGQFYSQVLWSDEHSSETDEIESVTDQLYRFFENRYLLEDIIYLCMHDFISAILEYSSVSKHIQLFCRVMVGNLDAATFRYLLIVGDLIDRVTWTAVGDFKVFVRLLYPFLNNDELDQAHLAYTSFSVNRVSKSLVYEYFMYVILKYRELRFQNVEVKLLQRPMREFGQMSLAEFIESLDALSPLVNERLGRKLYAESERHYSEEGKVSVARLAQIAGYLLLLQDATLLKQKMAEEVEDNRFSSASLAQDSTGVTQVHSMDESDEDIMTTAKLRNLAKKVAICEQSRRVRRIETNLRHVVSGD